jgi:hypothetical protein
MKLLPNLTCSSAFPILSYGRFTISDLTLRPFTNFELILAQGERQGFNLNLEFYISVKNLIGILMGIAYELFLVVQPFSQN